MESSFVKSVEGKLEAMSKISLQETEKAGIALCLEIRMVCNSVACVITDVRMCIFRVSHSLPNPAFL
jgi:hypothetical protein